MAFRIGFLASALVLLAPSVKAQTTVYTSATAFAASTEGRTTADFNALGSAFYGGPGYGNGIGSLTSNGITVLTSTDYLFSQNNNFYKTGTYIQVQQFSPSVATISFAAPSTALGFNYASGTPLSLTINGQSFAIAASPDPLLSFFGVTTSAAFSSAILSTPGGGFNLDNISFGTLANTPAVPEVTTWLMMIFGLGAVGSAMRCRRQAITTQVSHV